MTTPIMFRNQRTPGRKIPVPAPNNSDESTRIPINQKKLSITAPSGGNSSSKFSLVSPINASQPSSLKSGYLEVHSGGNPESPSRLYCVLSSNVLRCYSSSPDDTGVLADTAVPTYQFRMTDYALTMTRSGRPQAFALANKKKTHSIEFLCRNIGAMNQWTNILKSQAPQATPPQPQPQPQSHQNAIADEVSPTRPLSKLARRKAMVTNSHVHESMDSEYDQRRASAHTQARKRRSSSSGDHSIEKYHTSPTASSRTRQRDQEASRKSTVEEKQGTIHSTSWQSNMYGNNKHSSRRFSSSAEKRREGFSVSGNSLASSGRGSRSCDRNFDSSGERGRNSGREKIDFDDDMYDSGGESVSSSEADGDLGSSSDEDSHISEVNEPKREPSPSNKVSPSTTQQEKRYEQNPTSSRTSQQKHRENSAERGRVAKPTSKKPSSIKKAKEATAEVRGRGRSAVSESKTKSKTGTIIKSKVQKSIDPKNSAQNSGDRTRKKSASPSGLPHKDASVGFFDLYARHLNASRGSNVTDSPEISTSQNERTLASKNFSRSHSSPSPARQPQHQTRGFGSVRNMSPAQREEMGMNVPPSINSALENSDRSSLNALNRLKTPDDLRNKRPNSSSYSKSPHTRRAIPPTPTDTAEGTRLLSWLEKIGMERYADSFRQAGVNKLSVVELLRPQDLVTMRIHPQHIPTIMDSIREISRRTLSYAESVASPLSSSPTSSHYKSPRQHSDQTPSSHHQPINNDSSDILSSLTKRLQQKKGGRALNLANGSNSSATAGTGSPRLPANGLSAPPFSVEVLMKAFDAGSSDEFIRQWMTLQRILIKFRDEQMNSVLDEFHKLDFYCRLFFAIRPILTKSSPEKVNASMYSFKQYLEGFLSVANRTPAQQVLMNSRLYAAYAGIVMVKDPTSNPAYAAIFEPKWRQSLRSNMHTFVSSLQSFPRLWTTVTSARSLQENCSPRERPRLHSAEKEIKQALAALEDSQATLAASETLNNHLLRRPESDNQSSNTAKAKEQYRATIPQDYATQITSSSKETATTSLTAEASSSTTKIVLKPRSGGDVSVSVAKPSKRTSLTQPHFGYLQKQVKKGWKTRYFQLESRVLTYYLNDTMTNKKGELVVTAKCKVERFSVDDENGQTKEHCFKLTDSAFDRVIVLSAPDADCVNGWVSRIKALILSLEAKSMTSSPFSITSLKSSDASKQASDESNQNVDVSNDGAGKKGDAADKLMERVETNENCTDSAHDEANPEKTDESRCESSKVIESETDEIQNKSQGEELKHGDIIRESGEDTIAEGGGTDFDQKVDESMPDMLDSGDDKSETTIYVIHDTNVANGDATDTIEHEATVDEEKSDDANTNDDHALNNENNSIEETSIENDSNHYPDLEDNDDVKELVLGAGGDDEEYINKVETQDNDQLNEVSIESSEVSESEYQESGKEIKDVDSTEAMKEKEDCNKERTNDDKIQQQNAMDSTVDENGDGDTGDQGPYVVADTTSPSKNKKKKKKKK